MSQLRIVPKENIIEHSFRLKHIKSVHRKDKWCIKTGVKVPYIISRSPRLDRWVLRFGSSWCLLVEWSWWHNIGQWSRNPYVFLFNERYSQKWHRFRSIRRWFTTIKVIACHCNMFQWLFTNPLIFDWCMVTKSGSNVSKAQHANHNCHDSTTTKLCFDMGFKPILVASCRLSALPMNFTHEFASRWKHVELSLEALRSLQHPQRHRGNRLGVGFGSRDLDFY